MSTPGPEARIVPLKRSVCLGCVLAWMVAPALTAAGVVWGLFAWVMR